MKIPGKISMFINREHTTIEIEDDNANTVFCKVILTPEQLVLILSRQAYVDCELQVQGLDRIGKKHENKVYEFEIPEELVGSANSEALQVLAQSQLTDGWIAESYFSSQNSFFKKGIKDNTQYARVTIRRYI